MHEWRWRLPLRTRRKQKTTWRFVGKWTTSFWAHSKYVPPKYWYLFFFITTPAFFPLKSQTLSHSTKFVLHVDYWHRIYKTSINCDKHSFSTPKWNLKKNINFLFTFKFTPTNFHSSNVWSSVKPLVKLPLICRDVILLPQLCLLSLRNFLLLTHNCMRKNYLLFFYCKKFSVSKSLSNALWLKYCLLLE